MPSPRRTAHWPDDFRQVTCLSQPGGWDGSQDLTFVSTYLPDLAMEGELSPPMPQICMQEVEPMSRGR